MVNNPNLIPLNTGGINLDVLMNQGFPQLKLENELVIEKIFAIIAPSMDLKTGRMPFESFCELIRSF